MLALDDNVQGSILGRTNLGKQTFQIAPGMDLLGSITGMRLRIRRVNVLYFNSHLQYLFSIPTSIFFPSALLLRQLGHTAHLSRFTHKVRFGRDGNPS